jgi:hypothetical protein
VPNFNSSVARAVLTKPVCRRSTMKKIKKQRLSLQSTTIRNLDDKQLDGVAGGWCYTLSSVISQQTVYPCAKCTYAGSGCYNPN